jgi:signal peptidase II
MASADPIARKQRRFWGIAATVVVADAFTKMLAVDLLAPAHLPRAVIGDAVRLTLVYNSGAAFGLHLGTYSRWIFTALTIGALVLLAHLYRTTRAGDVVRTIAVSLVCGGAVGNLVDRLKSGRGVVDFIDVGIGTLRWPTFNVADMAVSCGALLLAFVLWREDATHAARAARGTTAATASGQDAPVHG